jgi:hypothetical protein
MRSSQKQPWEYHRDPNPIPSIAELEKSCTQEEIDKVLDRVIGTDGGVIIQRFKPHHGWLWRQWFGTVLFCAWPRVLINMLWAFGFCVFARHQTHNDFNFWGLEDLTGHPFVARLAIFDKIWGTLMSLTTFLLTFFVGQAYSFWRDFMQVGRSIQGRLNDIQLLLTSHAARNPKTDQYTKEAYLFLQDMARQLRLFHLLHWASHASRFRILLTPQGWDRMVTQGILTKLERERLHQLKIPETQKHYAVLQSALITSQKNLPNKNIIGIQTRSLERMLLSEFCRLRGVCGTVPDLVDCRMPLAYAHFVQILVDCFLVCTPIAK